MGNTFNHRGTETRRNAEKPTLTLILSLMERKLKGGILSLKGKRLKEGILSVGAEEIKGRQRRILTTLCLAITLMTTACDKLPQTLTEPTNTISFSGSTPGSNSVYMAQNSSLSSGDILAIDIKAKNISGVFGTAFDVDFDSSSMTYDSYVSGSFLETGGNTVNYQVEMQSNNSNKLVAGISRQAGASGISGSGTLVTLKFKVTGNSSVAFSNYVLKDTANQAISGISWYGGSVTVQ